MPSNKLETNRGLVKHYQAGILCDLLSRQIMLNTLVLPRKDAYTPLRDRRRELGRAVTKTANVD